MRALNYEGVSRKYESIKEQLGERRRRLWAGAEAKELGYGGIRAVSRATGSSVRQGSC
jgi:hypothetical protein